MPTRSTNRRERLGVSITLFVATVLALMPLLLHGTVSDSMDWQIHAAWLGEVAEALAAGDSMPRWIEAANDGFGAPVLAIYPPGLYWLLALAPTVDPLTRLLIGYALAAAATAWLGYRWLRCFVPRWPAAIGAAAIVAGPWFAFLVYRMNMLPGSMGYALMLGLLWRSERLAHGSSRGAAGVALAIAALCWVHTPSAIMASIAAVMCLVTRPLRDSFAILPRFALALVLGAALGAPAFAGLFDVEANLAAATRGVWDWRLHLLFADPRSGLGVLRFKPFLEATFSVGLALAVGSATVLLATRGLPHSARRGIACGSMLAILAVVLSSSIGSSIHAAIPAAALVQFPWRWMWSLACAPTLLLALAYAHASHRISRLFALAAAIAMVALGGVAAGWVPQPLLTPLTSIETREVDRTAADRPEHAPRFDTDASASSRRDDSSPRWIWLGEPGEIRAHRRIGDHYRWDITTAASTRVRIRLLAWSGWLALADDVTLPIERESVTGAIVLAIPAGTETISLEYRGGSWSQASRAVAWIVAISLLLLLAARAVHSGRAPAPN
jgi:hypothetical protein